jgi:hypothetical protein
MLFSFLTGKFITQSSALRKSDFSILRLVFAALVVLTVVLAAKVVSLDLNYGNSAPKSVAYIVEVDEA